MKSAIVLASLGFGLQLAAAAPKSEIQVVDIQVTEKGFEPVKVTVKAGTPVLLRVTRKTDATCAKQIKISSRSIKKDLPLNTVVNIDIGKLEKGDIAFACGMDMLTGHIIIQ